MSSVCRRRRSNQSGGSDAYDSSEDLIATKETQSSERSEHTDALQNSDDESYSNESEESQEGGPRESGDGQEEEKPQKKLDFDEDRRYPQYIPKRGTFYEHDDRTIEETADEATPAPNEREVKEKKVWKDKEDRWDHDRFNEHEQAPKSHEELIAVYGYDIRNEEGPPRARRRRRYGRGPNKYTRNWEDENAYSKPGGGTPGKSNVRRLNRSGEDFPALKTKEPNEDAPVEERVITSAWYNSKNKSSPKTQNFPPLQREDGKNLKQNVISNTQNDDNTLESTNSAWKEEPNVSNQNSNGNHGPGGDADQANHTKLFPKDSTKKNVQETVSLTTTKSRGRGMRINTNNNLSMNRMIDVKPKGRGQGKPAILEPKKNMIHPDNERQLIQEMKQINLNDSSQHQSGKHSNRNYYMQSPNQQQRNNLIPSRMQPQSIPQSHPPPHPPQLPPQQQASPQQTMQQSDASGNRPKRYSSLRQRPTVSENPPQQNYQPQHTQVTQHVQHQPHTQHGYFPPQAGNSRGVLESQAYPQGHFEQSPPVAPAATPMGGQPVMSLPPNGQTASYAPPPFLVPPPQFLPAQTTASIINYVAGPNGPAFPSNFQGYQGYNPTVQPQVPPPQELFQPQGCTYYSAAQQQHQQPQPAPVRRPKVAIPILPPPDNIQNQNRGRGRSNQQMNGQLVGTFRHPQNQHFSLNEFEHPITLIEEHQTVPGQFDDLVHSQQLMEIPTPLIEIENQPMGVIEIVDESVDLIEMDPPVVDEPITDNSSDKVTNDENDETTIEESNELKITQVPEDPVVEEAIA